jgi:hypothetical protein
MRLRKAGISAIFPVVCSPWISTVIPFEEIASTYS